MCVLCGAGSDHGTGLHTVDANNQHAIRQMDQSTAGLRAHGHVTSGLALAQLKGGGG